MNCLFCCILPVCTSLANEQAKPLQVAAKEAAKEDHVSRVAHNFRNGAVKKGWEGRDIGLMHLMHLYLFWVDECQIDECQMHKRCVDLKKKCDQWEANNEWCKKDCELHRWLMPSCKKNLVFEE